MIILKVNKMPEPANSILSEVWDFIKNNTLQAGVFALIWKGIDKVFKYFSEARDAELRKIVREEMTPDISELTKGIKELRDAIWHVQSKMK